MFSVVPRCWKRESDVFIMRLARFSTWPKNTVIRAGQVAVSLVAFIRIHGWLNVCSDAINRSHASLLRMIYYDEKVVSMTCKARYATLLQGAVYVDISCLWLMRRSPSRIRATACGRASGAVPTTGSWPEPVTFRPTQLYLSIHNVRCHNTLSCLTLVTI
jgi:hypothetical protein